MYDPDGKNCAACPIAQADHELLATYISVNHIGVASTNSDEEQIETQVTIPKTGLEVSLIHINGGVVSVTSSVPTDT